MVTKKEKIFLGGAMVLLIILNLAMYLNLKRLKDGAAIPKEVSQADMLVPEVNKFDPVDTEEQERVLESSNRIIEDLSPLVCSESGQTYQIGEVVSEEGCSRCRCREDGLVWCSKIEDCQ